MKIDMQKLINSKMADMLILKNNKQYRTSKVIQFWRSKKIKSKKKKIKGIPILMTNLKLTQKLNYN